MAPLIAIAGPSFVKSFSAPSTPHLGHLDLRAPAMREPAFRGSVRPGQTADAAKSIDEAGAFPGLSSGEAQVHTMSRAEAFARQFRHEGLPVARLWENHAALVSLGLNAKGKPGLWLVQKFP